MLLHPRTEAEDTRRLWIELGVPPERVTLEDQSRNTYENALFTKRLIDPKPGERWLLVRAVGVAVNPYPVDFYTTGGPLDWVPRTEANDNLRRFDIAVKEWVGLAVYNWTDRITALFPEP